MAGAAGIAVQRPDVTTDFHPLLCDRHEILLAEGLPCESLNPGDRVLGVATPAMRAELAALFPALALGGGFPMAARILRAHEARVAARWLAVGNRRAA